MLNIVKIINRKHVNSVGNKDIRLIVKCFGNFKCFFQGNKTVKWKTPKSEELFAFLLQYEGNPVPKEKIISALWPEMGTEKASKRLCETSFYINDLLEENGQGDIFIEIDGTYKIEADKINCDLFEFNRAINGIRNTRESIQVLNKAIQLYKGNYLGDKLYKWALDMRVLLEMEYEKIQIKLAETYIKLDEITKAKDVLNNIILYNRFSNEAYKMIIELSMLQEDRASAITYYNKYRRALKEELGIEPSAYIIRIMDI